MSSNGSKVIGSMLVLAVAAGLAGCGDYVSPGERGYTKAPLEEPGLFIEPELQTAMDSLGEPRATVPLGDPESSEEPTN